MAKTAPLLPTLAIVAALGALGACNSTDTTMGVLPPAPVAGIPLAPGAPMASVAAMPRRQTSAEVQFLPVIGAPTDKAAMLAEALSRSAASSGIAIRSSDAPAAPIRLKGYFSAVDEGPRTVLVYVWDVLDASDTRIGRIEGQEAVAGGGEPWSSVGPATLDAIAARTMGEAARLSQSL